MITNRSSKSLDAKALIASWATPPYTGPAADYFGFVLPRYNHLNTRLRSAAPWWLLVDNNMRCRIAINTAPTQRWHNRDMELWLCEAFGLRSPELGASTLDVIKHLEEATELLKYIPCRVVRSYSKDWGVIVLDSKGAEMNAAQREVWSKQLVDFCVSTRLHGGVHRVLNAIRDPYGRAPHLDGKFWKVPPTDLPSLPDE
jgi:hypothetical protein